MEEIKQWFSQFWYLALIFVAVCVGAFFIFKAASKSYSRYYAKMRETTAKLKHLNELSEKYKNMTPEMLENADEAELLEGLAFHYQKQLEKSEDSEKAFTLLPIEKRYIYALDVLTDDASVKTFFKENSSILTDIIIDALCAIGLEEEARELEKVKLMYDEKDLTTSIDYAYIETAENNFKEKDILTKIKHNAAQYIKNNAQLFV